MPMFAIFTFDDEHGPIKSWDRIKSIEIHNGRVKPIDHAIEGAPPPEFLIGSPAIVQDVRQRLIDHNIDPDAIREKGVIAYEAALSASHEFFFMGTAEQQRERIDRWKREQVAFTNQYYGEHRVVSMVLHQDEETPHIHLVLLPLKYDVDRRNRPPIRKWGLDGQVIAARGMWRQLHTDYAKAMAHFGLSRGEEGSQRKHNPYSAMMAQVEAERAALAMQAEDLARQHREADELRIKLMASFDATRDTLMAAEADRAAAAGLFRDAETRKADNDAVLAREAEVEQQFAWLRAEQEQLARDRTAAAEAARATEVERDSLRQYQDRVARERDALRNHAIVLRDREATIEVERGHLEQEARRARQISNPRLVQRAMLMANFEAGRQRLAEADRRERRVGRAEREVEAERQQVRADARRIAPALALADAFTASIAEVESAHWSLPEPVRVAMTRAKEMIRRTRPVAPVSVNDWDRYNARTAIVPTSLER